MIKSSMNSSSGFSALFVIVMVGAASLLMAKSSALLGLGELNLGYVSQKGTEAFFIADGCLEETLRRIRLDTTYGVGAGTINLTVENGTCDVDVTDLGSGQRRLVVLGTTDSYNKKIQTEITLTGNIITVDSWEELST